MNSPSYSAIRFLFTAAVFFVLPSCKSGNNAVTAFYYWKAGFHLNAKQSDILLKSANNRLYVRFFDVTWDEAARKAYPNAVVNFTQPATSYHITPVIYISNQTFVKSDARAIDSLAIHCNQLLTKLASRNNVNYTAVQFDCDWTIGTKEKYFAFLRDFKKINRHSLQATIRLHQVKYTALTGVPPADSSVLMFYNMGKPNTGTGESNSIYDATDAAKYLAYLQDYPLKLDVALPLFSWALQIRGGKIIQVYEKIQRQQLNNPFYFEQGGGGYKAKRSFFLAGVYIMENDIFKLEETDTKRLQQAAAQLAERLPRQNNRTIIYYELANLDFSEFNAETLLNVSARF